MAVPGDIVEENGLELGNNPPRSLDIGDAVVAVQPPPPCACNEFGRNIRLETIAPPPPPPPQKKGEKSSVIRVDTNLAHHMARWRVFRERC